MIKRNFGNEKKEKLIKYRYRYYRLEITKARENWCAKCGGSSKNVVDSCVTANYRYMVAQLRTFKAQANSQTRPET
jgi:hypothetical protein